MKVEKIVENRIEKHLDLVENNKEILNTSEVLPATINGEGDKNTDFRYARENMYHIIERGRDAMDELLEIAKAEESPRAFEVFGQLLKNMTDSQEKLMELHQKKQRMESDGERQEVTRAQNVTNALFVGSTAELLKLVKKEAKEK
jgi:transcription elongation GreA/GreB family factor